MKKIGWIVNNLAPSQLTYFLINNSNKLLQARSDIDIVAFYQNTSLSFIPMNFASMQVSEALCYDGTLISTDLKSTEKMLRCISSPNKLFYVWDLEWLRLQRKDYRTLASIYRHPDIKLIARSKEHAKIIETCWNKPVIDIIENCDMNKVVNL